jgi:proteic killer suppression protein
MKVAYANSRIQKLCTDEKYARKKLGENVAKFLRQRIKQMEEAESLDQLRHAAGDWHELIGDRKGQLACSVSGLTRLVFTPANAPLPTNPGCGLDWSQVIAVINLEIVYYH